ncbi:hypothetical protein CTAM01_02441 [Colletotrichum tamarilloi]|uniref:Uncharacterized protein n=1 Tax=Colletotrichum tamarilloi TaxID=1209934 RepID=A0ABQ9RNU9_9PEZI|nr:uncharacterized protein CTAM01_02441 [Colletotrichum tamarilloi]KAK1508655.1 hypothetical protein CTAM01_02441 [Colletotrichum tamarilloi]
MVTVESLRKSTFIKSSATESSCRHRQPYFPCRCQPHSCRCRYPYSCPGRQT